MINPENNNKSSKSLNQSSEQIDTSSKNAHKEETIKILEKLENIFNSKKSEEKNTINEKKDTLLNEKNKSSNDYLDSHHAPQYHFSTSDKEDICYKKSENIREVMKSQESSTNTKKTSFSSSNNYSTSNNWNTNMGPSHGMNRNPGGNGDKDWNYRNNNKITNDALGNFLHSLANINIIENNPFLVKIGGGILSGAACAYYLKNRPQMIFNINKKSPFLVKKSVKYMEKAAHTLSFATNSFVNTSHMLYETLNFYKNTTSPQNQERIQNILNNGRRIIWNHPNAISRTIATNTYIITNNNNLNTIPQRSILNWSIDNVNNIATDNIFSPNNSIINLIEQKDENSPALFCSLFDFIKNDITK